MALRFYTISLKRQCGHASTSKDPCIGAHRPTSTTTVADGYKSGYKVKDVEQEASQNRDNENDERGDAAVTRRSDLKRIEQMNERVRGRASRRG